MHRDGFSTVELLDLSQREFHRIFNEAGNLQFEVFEAVRSRTGRLPFGHILGEILSRLKD